MKVQGNSDCTADYEPFIPTPEDLIVAKLELAQLQPGEWVFDLGCGNGEVLIQAAQRFAAYGVGFDIRPHLVARAQARIRACHLEHKIRVHVMDFMQADIARADVVVLYLNRGTLGPLSRKLERDLKQGARVVTHTFDLPGWSAAAHTTLTRVGGQTEDIFLYQKGEDNLIF